MLNTLKTKDINDKEHYSLTQSLLHSVQHRGDLTLVSTADPPLHPYLLLVHRAVTPHSYRRCGMSSDRITVSWCFSNSCKYRLVKLKAFYPVYY